MVSKCANPACSATFRYLHDGTLFHVAVGSASPEKAANWETAPVERYWLCGKCSRKMTIVSDQTGILVVPIEQRSKPEKRALPARRWDSG